MGNDSSPNLSCKPSDGLYKAGHRECEKCFWKARQICQVYAIEVGSKDEASVLKEELKRIKELDV